MRVRFSDQTVVQREFESADKIGAVYDFVRGTLAEEYRDKTFTLCMVVLAVPFRISIY